MIDLWSNTLDRSVLQHPEFHLTSVGHRLSNRKQLRPERDARNGGELYPCIGCWTRRTYILRFQFASEN